MLRLTNKNVQRKYFVLKEKTIFSDTGGSDSFSVFVRYSEVLFGSRTQRASQNTAVAKKKCMESDKEGFSLLTQERCHPAQLSFGLQLSSPLGPAASSLHAPYRDLSSTKLADAKN
jgi:hypothetical protein